MGSILDGIWFSEHTGEEVDLDKLFGITSIKRIIFDEETREFYFLSNKKHGFIGFFLMSFP